MRLAFGHFFELSEREIVARCFTKLLSKFFRPYDLSESLAFVGTASVMPRPLRWAWHDTILYTSFDSIWNGLGTRQE
jgi:hypothetical protein